MGAIIDLLNNYVGVYINGMERLLQIVFYLPIMGIPLGYISIFLIICGFVFHWLIEFINGGDN